jgi:uncharacterized protein with NRDE domain
MSGLIPGAPLIVAANRDEFYARPAVVMTTLRDDAPRVLGGRDQVAGGTWLAVNEHGVVAGLTNQPAPGGRDLTRRSRGELPLAFAACRSAAEAVRQVCAELDPADYNPCWMLVGDRDALFSVGLAGGRRPEVERLPPGVHILENVPLRAPSAKAAQVARLVEAERARAADTSGDTPAATADALAAVLRDHRPALTEAALTEAAGSEAAGSEAAPLRPAALSAACVHTPEYGTRSALIVTVPAAGPPRLLVADGPPCQAPLRDASTRWAGPALV